jgi:uncharacterized membrane protein YkvA (DUF1232 family)
MPLTVTLEFSDQELEYFQSLVDAIRDRNRERSPHEITASAAAEVDRLRSAARSPFVARRIDRVGRLIAMTEDPDWALPEPERQRVLAALAYVAEAKDLVPDDVPVLGLVDDAIMLELLLRESHHELEAYEEFDAFRREQVALSGTPDQHRHVSVADWLDSRRQALHMRMAERRERDLARNGESFRLITRS